MARLSTPKYLVIHHTAGPRTQTPEEIRDFHVTKRGYVDIGYNYIIDGAGKLHTGRGLWTQGAHTRGYNSRSIGLAVIGNNSSDNPADHWTEHQLYQVRRFVSFIRYIHPAILIRGHGDLRPTLCPGMKIDLMGIL